MKKIISILLSLALCLGMWPPVALAVEGDQNVTVLTVQDNQSISLQEKDGQPQYVIYNGINPAGNDTFTSLVLTGSAQSANIIFSRTLPEGTSVTLRDLRITTTDNQSSLYICGNREIGIEGNVSVSAAVPPIWINKGAVVSMTGPGNLTVTHDKGKAVINNDGSLTIDVKGDVRMEALNGTLFKNNSDEHPISISAKNITLSDSTDNTSFAGVTLTLSDTSSVNGQTPAAKMEKDGVTTYLLADQLDAALANSGNAGATFTLLANVERTNTLNIKVNCTLDLGGHNITFTGTEYVWVQGSVTAMTIRGEGEIISEQSHALAVNGSVTLEGGTFTSNGENSAGVYVNSASASLSVTGEYVTIRNTGGGYGLAVNSAQSVQLSAGICEGEKAIEVFGSGNLASLLAEGCAYYRDGTPIALEADGQELTGTVTVKACNHAGEGVCTYTHNENTSTHTKTCLACGKTWDAENCDYGEYTHNDTSHTRICKLCGYQNVEAHNIKCTAEASGTVIAVSEACKTCGYGKDLGTVTIHIPKLVYGDLTGVVTAENTLTEPVAVAGNVKNPLGETIIFSDHVIIDPPTMATLTGNALLSAGEHKIKINIVIIRDENALAECELTFNVAPALLTADMVTLSAESATYSGTEQKPALSVQQGETTLTEGTDYEVSYKRGDAATTDFTNAGTVNITVTGKGNYTGSVEKTYTIGKATPTIAWANNSPVELTYTGQSVAIEPTVTLVNDENFSGTITYTYGTYSGPDLPTNVGTYSIKASIAEQGNYTAAQSEEMTLTIKKADVTVTAPTAKTLTYTGEAQALVEAGTANVGDMVYSTAQDGTYTKNIPTGTNAGTYDVWYKVEGTDNYNGTAPAKVAVTINKASHENVTVETSAKFGASRTYDIGGMLPDGAELGNITVSGGIFANPQPAVNEGVLSYTLAADQTNVNKIGTVTVPVSSSTNYNAFDLMIKITVADVDIPELTVDAISVTYTGQSVSDLKISGTAVANGTPVKGGWSFVPGQALTDVADSGLKEVIFTPEDSTLYGKAKGYAQVQIGKATPTLRLTASPTATTGGDVTFSLSGLPDGSTANLACYDKDITVTKNQDGTFTANIPQGGTDTTYTFTAAYAGDSNHEKANTSCSVQRKALTELPDPPADDGSNKFKLVMEEGISEVPAGLKTNASLDTPEELEAVMKTKVTEQTPTIPATNTAVYDVALLVSTDGGGNWTAATKDNFPAGGLTVTLPYPSGTDSSYTFTVVHMFTTTDFGNVIGDIETPTVTNTANGLRFTVTGLSPISVGWEKKSSGSSGGGGGWVSYYSVKVNESEHGKVTADRTSIYAGSTVTLTVQPDEGYKLDKITVTDSQNQAVELTEKNGKYTFKMPSRNVTVKADFVPAGSPSPEPIGSPSPLPSGSPTPTTSPSPSPKPWRNPFPDVSDTSWYIKAVEFVCKNGLMAGYENGKFGPNDSMTRAQFAQIIYNKAGRPQAGSGVFSDVTTGWYVNAVNWATAEGIVTGVGGGRFAPDRPITRQDLAVMLWRYAGSPEPRKNELDFSDAGKVSTYAWKALCWANENGIVRGKGNGILDPKGKATRAEVAQMLMNYLNK